MNKEFVEGHEQYVAFLKVAGQEFSPMCELRRPIEFGGRFFWTVEGMWQATKAVRLGSLEAVSGSAPPFEILSSDQDGAVVWFPAAGDIRSDFKRSMFFRCLKSGRKYRSMRNRLFGHDNWTFVGNYLPDARRIVTARPEALALIHGPAFRAQLQQFPEAIVRLRDMIVTGACEITPKMLSAHGHLKAVLEAVAQSGPAL